MNDEFVAHIPISLILIYCRYINLFKFILRLNTYYYIKQKLI